MSPVHSIHSVKCCAPDCGKVFVTARTSPIILVIPAIASLECNLLGKALTQKLCKNHCCTETNSYFVSSMGGFGGFLKILYISTKISKKETEVSFWYYISPWWMKRLIKRIHATKLRKKHRTFLFCPCLICVWEREQGLLLAVLAAG